ncbi:glycosyltransferase [Devosia aurantiaca]|uniref:Glycosyltransferase n=1 Tax=Devosia aurantiaca TaxID=2714858 RepID=A0A6M1SS17_9HYPH|nr:nucleotide disphospho-sugar-binding domain-containing protein [Devosia aurantiaca]NGP17203.1 glycosyltransferase [Devosia aurantiaca]
MQGHLGPAAGLAAALNALGHQCFLVHHPQASVDPVFQSIPIDASQCSWTPASFVARTRSSGLPFGVLKLVREMAAMTDSLCRMAPDLLRRNAIDAVVTDQLEPAGALVAEHLGLPYVSLAAAHPINREPLVPVPFLDWPYEDTPKAIERNRVGTWVADKLTARHDHTVAEWSARWGLGPYEKVVDCLSPLADISQLVPGLDFPRQELSPAFHYVGPLRRAATASSPSLAKRQQPVVFASLGTLQNHRLPLFKRIAQACRQLGVKLIVSHANGLTERQAASIDADLVVPWVNYAEIMAEADAVITHGGINTVLDALAAGLPILCMPLAFEQPGIGARLDRSGAGKVLSHRAGSAAIAAALGDILTQPSYRERAGELAAEIRSSGGADGAASIVEQAFTGGGVSQSSARSRRL